MPLQQLVELVGLSDAEFTGGDTGVVDTQDGVDVFHALCSDIGKLLNLVCGILNL